HRYRGSGSRAAPRARAPPCSSPRLRGRRSLSPSSLSPRHRLEELVEAGEAYSRRVGALDRDSLSRRETRDGAEHRDPVIAAGIDAASAQPGGNARHGPAVVLRMDAGAEWSQPVRDRLDPVRLLDPQLTRAGDTCLAA